MRRRRAREDALTRPHAVLVHGLGVSRRYFRPLRDELGRDFTVHAPDLPGFGDAARPPRALSVPELADALAGILDASEVRSPIVVGNSMGCQVAVELAVRRPELAHGLVLVGPTVDPAARSLRRHFARLALDTLREPLALNVVVAANYLRTGPLRTIASARRMIEHRIDERLPLVTQTSVVVRGERDPIVPQRWGEHAAALLANGRLDVVPRAPHAAHWTHAPQVAAAVRSVA